MTPSEFFSDLFGHPSLAGLLITIWEKQTLDTATFELPATDDAAEYAEERAEAVDVYIGTCPYREVERGKRGKEEHAGALVATWLDIDIEGPAHKGKTRPAKDLAAALELLSKGPKPPTVVVHSGHGLHAWWALGTPMLLASGEDRKRARRVTDGWIALYDRIAKGMGFDLDPVGDLARVLRIPGTFNHKLEETKKVEALAHAAR